MLFSPIPFANTLIWIGLTVQVLSALGFAFVTRRKAWHEVTAAIALMVTCLAAVGGFVLAGINPGSAEAFLVWLVAEGVLILALPIVAGVLCVISDKGLQAKQYALGVIAIAGALVTFYGVGVAFTGRT
jgi:hypothetical protein